MAEVGQRISASSAEQENKWPKVKGLQMANLHYGAENSRGLDVNAMLYHTVPF